MELERSDERLWLARIEGAGDAREQLEELLVALADRRPMPDVVVDLAGVRLLNSGNLSQLLRIRHVVIENDARLRLAGAQGEVWGLFTTTGLDKVFVFADDAAGAVAELEGA